MLGGWPLSAMSETESPTGTTLAAGIMPASRLHRCRRVATPAVEAPNETLAHARVLVATVVEHAAVVPLRKLGRRHEFFELGREVLESFVATFMTERRVTVFKADKVDADGAEAVDAGPISQD